MKTLQLYIFYSISNLFNFKFLANISNICFCSNFPKSIKMDHNHPAYQDLLTFLILNFRLYIFDRIRRLDLEGDGLTGKSFHKDLHDR